MRPVVSFRLMKSGGDSSLKTYLSCAFFPTECSIERPYRASNPLKCRRIRMSSHSPHNQQAIRERERERERERAAQAHRHRCRWRRGGATWCRAACRSPRSRRTRTNRPARRRCRCVSGRSRRSPRGSRWAHSRSSSGGPLRPVSSIAACCRSHLQTQSRRTLGLFMHSSLVQYKCSYSN